MSHGMYRNLVGQVLLRVSWKNTHIPLYSVFDGNVWHRFWNMDFMADLMKAFDTACKVSNKTIFMKTYEIEVESTELERLQSFVSA